MSKFLKSLLCFTLIFLILIQPCFALGVMPVNPTATSVLSLTNFTTNAKGVRYNEFNVFSLRRFFERKGLSQFRWLRNSSVGLSPGRTQTSSPSAKELWRIPEIIQAPLLKIAFARKTLNSSQLIGNPTKKERCIWLYPQ